MPSAESAAASLAPGDAELRRARRRGPQINRALLVFNLLTILVTLLLGHHIMSGYERSVSRSVAWSMRVVLLGDLIQRAHEVNAPANDVFRSHDAPQERLRRNAALRAFAQHRQVVMQDLSREVRGGPRRYLERQIALADAEMRLMTRQSEIIFNAFARGDHAHASRQMAEMDRTYGRLAGHLRKAISAIEGIEGEILAEQVSIASALHLAWFLFLLLIILVVLAVASYGCYLARILRAAGEAHDAMLAKLASANEALEHYADYVAHELRSPINKILMNAEVTLSRPRSRADYQEALAWVMEDAQDLAGIVSSLLFLARARGGGFDLQPQTLDLGVQLELIRAYFEAAAQQAGVELSVACPPEIMLDADRALLHRAIGNLVTNAIRHTAPGGMVTVAVSRTAAEVTIQVVDTGEGMPAEVQARAFERFYRAGAARVAGAERFGLGLPIAKSIVDLHGGQISITSRENCGTTVAIQLKRYLTQTVIAA